MQFFRDTFNNREIAIIIWCTLFLCWLFLKKDIRSSLASLLSFFFKNKIFVIFLVMTLYIIGIVTLLNRVNFWDLQLLKDTIIWYFGVAIVMFVNTNEVYQDENYFKKIIIDNIKLVLVLEFIINLYTFSLPVELIFVPLITIIVIVHTFTEIDDKYKIVKNYLFKVLTVVSVVHSCNNRNS